ncbi:MAG: MATE family efflux transporter [Synergistaceae bacterium]|nr:MATE family efflux transporter [Synergistaceae bacterium]
MNKIVRQIRNFISPGAQNLTRGSIRPELIRFAVPLVLANLLQALYGAVDMIIVGHFTDSVGLSAVALGAEFMHTISSFIIGFCFATTTMIGNYYGAGQKKDIKETISTQFSICLLCALLVSCFVCFNINKFVQFLGTPAESFSVTKDYVFICSMGLITVLFYNGISAIFRGFGDSVSPLIFVGISCMLNVLGDLLLVGGFKLGAAGAAYATVASQGVSAFLAYHYATARDYQISHGRKLFKIYKDKFLRILRLGFPSAIQFSIVGLSFIFIVRQVCKLEGVTGAAACGVVTKLDGFAMLLPMSFNIATGAMVAQCVGAKKYIRARNVLKQSILVCASLGIFILVALELFPEVFIHIFTNEKEVVLKATQYLRSFAFDVLLVCFVFSFGGFFMGIGRTEIPMVVGIITAGIRIFASYLLSGIKNANMTTLGFALPLTSLIQIFIFVLIFYRQTRHLTLIGKRQKP